MRVEIPCRASTEPRHIVVDSTGLKVYGEGELTLRGFSQNHPIWTAFSDILLRMAAIPLASCVALAMASRQNRVAARRIEAT